MEKEDQLLRQLIQESHTEQGPPLSFTPNVVRALEAQKAKKANPLIGRKTWFLIALGFGSLVIVLFILSPSSTELPRWVSEADKLGSFMDQITMPLAALIMGAVLMLADDIWRRVKKITPFS